MGAGWMERGGGEREGGRVEGPARYEQTRVCPGAHQHELNSRRATLSASAVTEADTNFALQAGGESWRLAQRTSTTPGSPSLRFWTRMLAKVCLLGEPKPLHLECNFRILFKKMSPGARDLTFTTTATLGSISQRPIRNLVEKEMVQKRSCREPPKSSVSDPSGYLKKDSTRRLLPSQVPRSSRRTMLPGTAVSTSFLISLAK